MNDEDENIRAKARTTFFRPKDAVKIHRGNLPHWRQVGVTYFVAGRLADSMPQAKLKQWQNERAMWLKVHGIADIAALDSLPERERNEFHSRFTRQWHEWLDAGYGECLLRRSDVRELFVARPTGGDGDAWHLDAWVVMPNHFHATVTPAAMPLGKAVQQWKGGSSRDINAMLGRAGALWQAEPYDHIIRSEAQWSHYRRYIADNPVKAKLGDGEYAVGVGKVVWASAQKLKEHFEKDA